MNTQVSNQKMEDAIVAYKTVKVDGLSIFYREIGDRTKPKLVLLHGFPSSSHQYRNLLPALANHFHVVAPDYPGFGNSEFPSPDDFDYTFDRLSEVIEDFLKAIDFKHFGLYMQDYGGPVGFRIITRHPDWLEWLILQNTNAYEVGFTNAWDGLRNALWKGRSPQTEAPLYGLLKLDTIRQIYLQGHRAPAVISPDNWNMDFSFLEGPNVQRLHMDLFYDYRKNVELYPKWQRFLQDNQPETLIYWGQNDIFFTREGGEAYLEDLPNAQMHRLDSGHFALEDCLYEISTGIIGFYLEKIVRKGQGKV
jgi:pimeloyl-ACP methyl ester carboxylesterase